MVLILQTLFEGQVLSRYGFDFNDLLLFFKFISLFLLLFYSLACEKPYFDTEESLAESCIAGCKTQHHLTAEGKVRGVHFDVIKLFNKQWNDVIWPRSSWPISFSPQQKTKPIHIVSPLFSIQSLRFIADTLHNAVRAVKTTWSYYLADSGDVIAVKSSAQYLLVSSKSTNTRTNTKGKFKKMLFNI